MLLQRGAPPGVTLPAQGLTDGAAVAAIILITGGNFRPLERLLTQTERLLEINALPAVTRQVIEAARESLVIFQGLFALLAAVEDRFRRTRNVRETDEDDKT